MLPSSKFGGTCPPQGFLLCKNPCGWAAMGDGGPHRRAGSPRAKKFPEEICFAPSRVSQVCRTPDYRAFKSTQARSTGTTVRTGQPGVPEGPLPLCFRRSPEGTLPRVPSGQLLPGGSTRRFFAQLGCILPTPNAPGQRVFLRCAASFFLEIRQYSCGKMSCAT